MNWSQAEKALETSLNSAGSAAKENAAYIDSIEGRIAQLKATFEDLSADVVNSEMFKFLVNTLNALLKLIDGIVEKTDGIVVPVAAAMVAMRKMGIKSEEIFDNIIKRFQKKSESKIKIKTEVVVDNNQAKEDIKNKLDAQKKALEKYYSSKRNTKNSKHRAETNLARSFGFADTETTDERKQEKKEFLDLVRGCNNTDEAMQAFVAKQEQRVNELANKANATADAIEAKTNSMPNADDIPLEDIDEQPNKKLDDTADGFDNIAGAANDAEKDVKDLAESMTSDIGEGAEVTQDAADNMKDMGQQAASVGTVFKGILKNIGVGILATIALKIVSAIAKEIEKAVNKTQHLQEALNNLSEECSDLKSELDDINSKLEENAKKIDEINNNHLEVTSPDDLKNLQKQNEQLEIQRQTLQTIYDLKQKKLDKDTKEVLGRDYLVTEDGTYKNWFSQQGKIGWEAIKAQFNQYQKGFSEINFSDVLSGELLPKIAKIVVSGSIVGAVQNAIGQNQVTDYLSGTENNINKYNKYQEELKTLDLTNPKDIVRYHEINQELESITLTLAEQSSYLLEQKGNLSETSEEYVKIEKILSSISDLFDENNQPVLSLPQQLYEEYSKEIDGLEDKYKKFVNTTNEKRNNFKAFSANKLPSIEKDGVKQTFSNAYLNGQNEITSYEQLLKIIRQINIDKEKGLVTDNEDLKILTDKLYKLAGIEEEEVALLDYYNQLQAYDFIDKFISSGSFEGKKSFADIGAESYKAFEDAILNEAGKNGYDTEIINSLLASIFPSYQTVEDRLYSYYKQNSASKSNVFAIAINKALAGSLDADVIENLGLTETLNNLGIEADNAANYFIQLAKAIRKERIEAAKAKAQELSLDFNTDKQEYDDKASSNINTFKSAVSTISAGNSISYEDMWTLINADEELAGKFRKTVDGYTISVEDLVKAKDKYRQTQIDTYEENIRNAEAQIAESERHKAEIEEQIKSVQSKKPTNSSEAQEYASKLRQLTNDLEQENEVIQDNNNTIAENQLMLEEITGSTNGYAEAIENLTSLLSNWQDAYESIIKDMRTINKLSASSILTLMKLTDNWANLITFDDKGNPQIDENAFKEEMLKQAGISPQMDDVQAELNELAKQYNSVNEIDWSGDYEKSLVELSKEIEKNGELTDEQKDEYQNLIKRARTLKTVTGDLMDAFDEGVALAKFNEAVADLDHQLEMGIINTETYNKKWKEAKDTFVETAMEDGDIDSEETQEAIYDTEETEYDQQQNKYQRDFDDATQALEDAYEQRLINAQDYYDQMKELEDQYYGTETSKGKLDDPDEENVKQALRSQKERRVTLYTDSVADLQQDYSRGLIDFNQLEEALRQAEAYWLKGIDGLEKTLADNERENSIYLYEQELAIADKALDDSLITNTQHTQELRRIWEKYYKDREGYAEESYEAEKRLLEGCKNDVQAQIDGVQSLIDANEQWINSQIEGIEKQNEDIEKYYDDQIKKIDDIINAIEDEADEEERVLKLKEAQAELEKASQRTRKVYGADGTVQYKVDDEKYSEAKKNYDDAVRDEIVAQLNDQKEALEKEKESKLETNNQLIADLNKQLASVNQPLETLVAVLSANLAQTYGISPEAIAAILTTDASQKELEKQNKFNKNAGKDTYTTGQMAQTAMGVANQVASDSVSQNTKNEQLLSSYEVINTGDFKSNLGEQIKGLMQLMSTSPATNVSTENAVPKVNNVEVVPQTVSNDVKITIGDIVVNNPVGNSSDLAKELMMNLPNAFQNQMYTNLKK